MWLADKNGGAFYSRCKHGRAGLFCPHCSPIQGKHPPTEFDERMADALHFEHFCVRRVRHEPGWDANGAPV